MHVCKRLIWLMVAGGRGGKIGLFFKIRHRFALSLGGLRSCGCIGFVLKSRARLGHEVRVLGRKSCFQGQDTGWCALGRRLGFGGLAGLCWWLKWFGAKKFFCESCDRRFLRDGGRPARRMGRRDFERPTPCAHGRLRRLAEIAYLKVLLFQADGARLLRRIEPYGIPKLSTATFLSTVTRSSGPVSLLRSVMDRWANSKARKGAKSE